MVKQKKIIFFKMSHPWYNFFNISLLHYNIIQGKRGNFEQWILLSVKQQMRN